MEKIQRDVRITRIYEGTSEILESVVGRARWLGHLQQRGAFYEPVARQLEDLHEDVPTVGAALAARTLRALDEALGWVQRRRLLRHPHVLFRLGSLMARAEVCSSFVRGASGHGAQGYRPHFAAGALPAMSRIYARSSALHITTQAGLWLRGADGVSDDELPELHERLGTASIQAASAGLLADLDEVAAALAGQ